MCDDEERARTTRRAPAPTGDDLSHRVCLLLLPRVLQEALEPALALGVALQLTNILRDVGEDRVRQRIYLPQEDLKRFGVTEQALLKGVKDEKYVAMLKFQIQRARDWYKRAEDGIPMLSEDCQLPIRASLDMYSTILNKIEENGESMQIHSRTRPRALTARPDRTP